jgi:hypothetical protein
MKIRVFNLYEDILDLNGFEFSMTVEIDEIINTALYKTSLDTLN